MSNQCDFKEIEESVLKFWLNRKIYEKIQKRNKNGKKFFFLQGPPYTSGRLHIAHAWNNSLKDMAMRYKRMQGFNVWDRAGYDMHGLPTENKVQKNLKLKYKEDILKYGLDKFIKECKKFSTNNAKLMDKDLQRLGIWMDYNNAYYPINNEFIEGEWWLIKQAHKQGRLYKGKKIMHWCASCETALAKHELEYKNVKEESIFLKFKVKDNLYLIIWTTTPWTIPHNLGVMVNPELDYVKIRIKNEIWIVAKALAGAFIQGVLNEKLKILEEFKGKKLEGLEYTHPLYDELKKDYDNIKSKNLHTVWLSKEYVDTTAGTGLVHSAPGSGPEDYEVGTKYGLPPYNKLNEKGEFVDAGPFTGWTAKKDDKKMIEYLKKKGSLIKTSNVEHEYAHCWRCKNPVVFRATEQWFLKIEDLINKMIKNNKEVKWVPKFTSENFNRWVEALRDNSITRQRFWGAPVPIWECEKCKHTEVIESVEELKKLKAKDIPDDLHRPWIDKITIKCSKCKEDMKRVEDVIDVWIDAGTTSWNCLYNKKDLIKKYFPADFILEATEQIRLWFSMLSICSTIAFDKNCYENVFCHGMILDYQGTKMSKSLGNIISPYEVIDKYGSDILRYYMCQTKAGENINFNWEDVKQKQRNLTVLWNIQNFLINLCKENNINPDKITPTQFEKQEKYIISKLNSTIKNVTYLFDNYKLDETIGEIEKLFLALSRTYMQLTRDKASIGSKEDKEVVIYTIYNVLLETLKMFCIVSPFITEKIYQNLKENFSLKHESIHMFKFPKYNEKLIDSNLEKDVDVYSNILQAVLYAREKANLGLRWPVKDVIITTKDEKIAEAAKNTEELIKNQANIKEIKIQETLPGIKESVKADFKQLGPDFKDLAPKIIAKLALESAQTVLSHIEKDKSYKIKIDGKVVGITKEHLIIQRDIPSNFVENEFKGGFIYLNKERTDELEAEGFAREIMRRIQSQRKKAELTKTDKITLFIKTDEELKEILTKFESQIKEKVGAEILKISELDPGRKHKFSSKEKVKDKVFEVFFDKV